MYREAEWREVHRLRAEGMSKSRIARRLGMSRNTVYRLLSLHEPPTFAGRIKLTAREEEVLARFARLLIDQAYELLNSKK